MLVTVLMLATAAPALGGRRHQHRTVKSTYVFSPVTGGGISGWFNDDYGVFFGPAWSIETKSNEQRISVAVADNFSEAVAAAVWQRKGPLKVICGTADDLKIKGGKPVFIQVFFELTPGEGEGCASPGLPTEGTITATIE